MGRYSFNRRNEPLKERTISIRITDSDLQALSEKCGRHGILIKDLFEIFVGDLIGGSFYSGSDEGDLADRWFDRHGFSFGENSLLHHLLNYGDATIVGTFLEAWNEKKYYDEHPEEISDIYDDGEIPWFTEEIEDDTSEWSGEITDEEIEKIKKWMLEYQSMKGEDE